MIQLRGCMYIGIESLVNIAEVLDIADAILFHARQLVWNYVKAVT